MNEQCPFFDGGGNGSFQCNHLQAIPRARSAIGYEEVTLSEVQAELCKSADTSRETICPAFGELEKLGRKSQFAKPTTNNRPLR